ncbi:MAG: demethoxyubiquinone hydroxylase family protein [Pseudomonadota bacterium]
MIRVDHAGEYGAVQIYRGQRAVFEAIGGDREIVRELREMEDGEQRHLETFDDLIHERRVRPTAFAPLWNAAGFALGAATALIGEKAAMACTTAVEEVIEEHYGDQSEELAAIEPELKETVDEFRADEIEHKETAIAAGAKEAFAYPLLSAGIKSACRLAIRLSEKV